jgi:hypothetical protein
MTKRISITIVATNLKSIKFHLFFFFFNLWECLWDLILYKLGMQNWLAIPSPKFLSMCKQNWSIHFLK